jgi:hypothetical protein
MRILRIGIPNNGKKRRKNKRSLTFSPQMSISSSEGGEQHGLMDPDQGGPKYADPDPVLDLDPQHCSEG